jgi:hypothetical protein
VSSASCGPSITFDTKIGPETADMDSPAFHGQIAGVMAGIVQADTIS